MPCIALANTCFAHCLNCITSFPAHCWLSVLGQPALPRCQNPADVPLPCLWAFGNAVRLTSVYWTWVCGFFLLILWQPLKLHPGLLVSGFSLERQSFSACCFETFLCYDACKKLKPVLLLTMLSCFWNILICLVLCFSITSIPSKLILFSCVRHPGCWYLAENCLLCVQRYS